MKLLPLLRKSALVATALLGWAVQADARTVDEIKKDGKIVIATEGQIGRAHV
jgi:hypothetical protein